MKEKQLIKGKQRKEKGLKNDAKREHRIAFRLNDTKYNENERYLRNYKITTKSKWYRSTILAHAWKIMDVDYPTLLNENEMRR